MTQPLAYELNNKNPDEKKRFIRNLFNSIVPTYDLLNHLLSFGTDILWRKRIFRHIHSVKDTLALDLCCGTGDLSLLLTKSGARTVSLDFSLNMLEKGKEKKALAGYCVAADASRLPFRDNIFNTATIAFGIRNIPDLHVFIKDVYRALAPGGELAILELVRPKNVFIKKLYPLYLRRILPIVGGIISGRLFAYKYLSKTIETFVDTDELRKILEEYGFKHVSHYPQTLGVAAIIVCKKGNILKPS